MKNTTQFNTMFLPCQSGKTRQMIRAIRLSYQQHTHSPHVPFILTTNHSQLTLQTSIRLQKSLANKYKIFVLNSVNSYHPNQLFYKERIVYNPSADVVLHYLQRFHLDEKKESMLPPLFIALSNNHQVKKVLSFIDFLVDSASYPIDLYFDEADITYVSRRDDWIPYLYRCSSITLITATPQPLLESGFDEIPLFQPYPVQFSKDFSDMYLNHLDLEHVLYPNTEAYSRDPNQFIIDAITKNFRHFAAPLPNGQFRKIIAISTMFTTDHYELAKTILHEFAFNVLTINSLGIVLYTINGKQTFKLRTELSQLLHTIHTTVPGVADAPLVVLGNRRIDRGITFHLPDEDMLFRDIIIPPHIKRIPRLVQVLGRIAGYIKHKLTDDDKIHIFTKPLNT
jgi:hypothetical protein